MQYKTLRKRRGFALVLAIGAMAFMVLLTLTLSAVISSKLRLLTAQKEQRIARSNAILGLSVAISNLQRSLGPDRAISAPATILDSKPDTVRIDDVVSPYLVGAFKVNKGDEFSSLLELQDENRKYIDMLKNRESVSNLDAINWLVSTNRPIKNPATDSLRDLNKEVIKLAEYKMLDTYPQNLGGDVDYSNKLQDVEVLAGKIPLKNGSYAWWVSDESLKAKINLMRPETYLDGKSMGEALLFEAPADSRIAQISNLDFWEEISNLNLNPFLPSHKEESAKILRKVSSLDEFALISSDLKDWAKDNKGDYTTVSVGLPVDVVNGRLKEDLTVYLQTGKGLNDTDPIIRGNFAIDKYYTGVDFGILDYSKNMPRMGLLKGYASLIDDGENREPRFETAVMPQGHKSTPYEVQHGIFPVVSAVSYHFQLFYDNNLSTDNSLNLYLMFYPRVRIWNPHSVRLERANYILKIGLPYTIQVFASESPINGSDNRTFGAFIARGDTEKYLVDPNKPETTYYYNPYAVFKTNTSRGVFEKHFVDVFKNRMLSRGKSDSVRSDGNLRYDGMPAISLGIRDLALNPGENVELTIQETKEFRDYISGNQNGVVDNTNINNLPQLEPGVIAHPTAQTIDAGKGGAYFSINTRSKEPTVVAKASLSNSWDSAPFNVLKSSIMQASKLKTLHANWRVVPSYFLNDVRAQDKVKFPPRPSYELWRVSGKNAPEFLTSMDFTALDEDGKPNTSDGKGFFNDYWFVEGHNEHNSVFMPYRFTTAIGWDNSIMKEWQGSSEYRDYFLYGYMKQPSNSGWYQVSCYMGYGLANYFKDSGIYQWENGNMPKCILPRIPTKNELINGALGVNTFNNGTYFVSKVDSNTASSKSPYYNLSVGSNKNLGMLKSTDSPTTFDDAHNANNGENDRRESILMTSHSWSMCTYSPPKGWGGYWSASRFWQWPMLSNFLRDSGEACRVYKPHGMVAPLVCLQNDPPRKTLLAQTHFEVSSEPWPSFNLIDENGKIPNATGVKGSMAWISNYRTTGDRYSANDRYTAPVLMDCKTSGSQLRYLDWSLVIPVFDYPRSTSDLMSLAAFSNANLSMLIWQPTFAFSESFANPFVRRDSVINKEDAVLHENELIDLSYLLNTSMWDRFFLSTFPQKNAPSEIKAGMRLVNTRNFLVNVPSEKSKLYGSEEAFENAARFIAIDGAFNVNSTSYEAWRALLGGLLATQKKSVLEGAYPQTITTSNPDEYYMPNPGNLNPLISPQDANNPFGFRDVQAGRNISKSDIDRLAREIVAEVKRRAPFFGLADFINRRLISFSDAKTNEDLNYQSLMGTISAAIDRLSNKDFESNKKGTFYTDSNFNKRYAEMSLTNVNKVFKEYSNQEEFAENAFSTPVGKKYQRFMGLAGAVLKQSQILNAIGPVITTRGDTFTIRAFGEYKNPMSNSSARMYCEAVVQRSAEPAKSGDDKLAPQGKFGRAFKIVSFRWLSPSEL